MISKLWTIVTLTAQAIWLVAVDSLEKLVRWYDCCGHWKMHDQHCHAHHGRQPLHSPSPPPPPHAYHDHITDMPA